MGKVTNEKLTMHVSGNVRVAIVLVLLVVFMVAMYKAHKKITPPYAQIKHNGNSWLYMPCGNIQPHRYESFYEFNGDKVEMWHRHRLIITTTPYGEYILGLY